MIWAVIASLSDRRLADRAQPLTYVMRLYISGLQTDEPQNERYERGYRFVRQ
jgi:hypothetical protein